MGGGASASEKVGIVLDDAKKVSAAAKALKAGLKNTPEGREAIKAAKARLEAQQAAQEAWELAMEEQAAGAAANEPQVGAGWAAAAVPMLPSCQVCVVGVLSSFPCLMGLQWATCV